MIDAFGSLNGYTQIRFISDDYDSGYLDLDDVLNGYYYASPTSDPDEVTAIIALQYGVSGQTQSSTDCLRNFFGQGDDPDEDTMAYWVKNLDEIHLY